MQLLGVPDVKYGEVVAAWIVLKPGEQATEAEIRDCCRDQIAHDRLPRHVRFVPALPMPVTGRAQQVAMRAQMTETLGLQEARRA